MKVDRMSMLNSLDVRCPLLDAEVVGYMAALPTGLKLRGVKTKYLLKHLIHSRLPPGTADRPKHGFGVTVGRWLRDDLRDLLPMCCLRRMRVVWGWMNKDVLREHWEQHLSGVRDNTNELLSVLILELWLRGVLTTSAPSAKR